jgi:hypothetical protein
LGIKRNTIASGSIPTSKTATLEIRTGQKTVLEYLFRPLQNVSQALRER